MSILIVGEKPSVSRAISSVVGADKVQKGYTEGNGYIVSWCVGHLVGLKYPNGYGNGWEQKWSFSQLPMIPEKWLFKVTDSTKAQYNIIKDLMNRGDVTEIICATDADREGECIFRYVYNMARCRKPVKRLWVSSLEESAIRKALTNMKPMSAYDCLFDAGYARAKADWLVGMNGSRLFSVRYGGKLNIGRVQTPTLAMIVQRDHDVEHFVKQKYFTADLNCGDFILSSARIDDEANADTLVSACDSKTVTICSVKREVKTEKAPKLYDLTTLQREANKAYGYTAQQTLDYTQSLYEGKLVTYPRTDSQYLSDDMAQTAFDVLWLCDNIFGFAISHTPDISKVSLKNRRCLVYNEGSGRTILTVISSHIDIGNIIAINSVFRDCIFSYMYIGVILIILPRCNFNFITIQRKMYIFGSEISFIYSNRNNLISVVISTK